MKHPVPLMHGKYYHIYSRGINGCTIFQERGNYEHFLKLYDEYISPVADTFAWVLMKNHFHFLVRIKDYDDIGFVRSRPGRWIGESPSMKKCNPSTQFGHLLNAYAKGYNKRYKRTGSLFEKPFRRLRVDNQRYFKTLIYYIHNNPVKHGFCESMMNYPWSSFLTLITLKPTKLQRETVLGWFNSESEFLEYHMQNHDTSTLEDKIFGIPH